jgi:hypothetical protein
LKVVQSSTSHHQREVRNRKDYEYRSWMSDKALCMEVRKQTPILLKKVRKMSNIIYLDDAVRVRTDHLGIYGPVRGSQKIEGMEGGFMIRLSKDISPLMLSARWIANSASLAGQQISLAWRYLAYWGKV